MTSYIYISKLNSCYISKSKNMNIDNACGQGAQLPMINLYYQYPFIPFNPYYMMPTMVSQPAGFYAFTENTAFTSSTQPSQCQVIQDKIEPGELQTYQKEEPEFPLESEPEEQPIHEAVSSYPKTRKIHRCHICKKVLSRPSALKLHMNSHSSVKLYSCSICSKRFSYQYNLKIHMLSHEEKSYKCDICVKRFSDENQLDEHSKVHSNCIKIECNICRKRFKRLSSLTVHLRIHSGEKPFKCSVCRKAFISSGNLKVHLRVHVISTQTDERPFKCYIEACGKSFKTKSQLKAHLVSLKHKEQ